MGQQKRGKAKKHHKKQQAPLTTSPPLEPPSRRRITLDHHSEPAKGLIVGAATAKLILEGAAEAGFADPAQYITALVLQDEKQRSK